MDTTSFKNARRSGMQSLSPRDLAVAVGSSESSLKRWVDDGQIVAERTEGGHRRITIREAIRFIRESKTPLVQPEMLGLEHVSGALMAEIRKGRGEALLLESVAAGSRDRSAGIVQGLYLCGQSAAVISDGAVAHAVHRYTESRRAAGEIPCAARARAADVLAGGIGALSALLLPTPADAPAAIVRATPGPWTSLRGEMAAVVLEECGYRLAGRAGVDGEPVRLAWLSAESDGAELGDTRRQAVELQAAQNSARALAAQISTTGGRVALCGQRLPTDELETIEHVHVVLCMAELGSLARSLLSGRGASARGDGGRGGTARLR